MIVFDLACKCGFLFEGWFSDYAEFNRQKREGELICPNCGGRDGLRKVLSPVAYQKKALSTAKIQESPIPGIAPSRMEESVRQTIRSLQKFVEKNFADVGSDFAAKTLKIHYGVDEPKNIRGVMTYEEEKMLDREGIQYVKIPFLAKKENN